MSTGLPFIRDLHQRIFGSTKTKEQQLQFVFCFSWNSRPDGVLAGNYVFRSDACTSSRMLLLLKVIALSTAAVLDCETCRTDVTRFPQVTKVFWVLPLDCQKCKTVVTCFSKLRTIWSAPRLGCQKCNTNGRHKFFYGLTTVPGVPLNDFQHWKSKTVATLKSKLWTIWSAPLLDCQRCGTVVGFVLQKWQPYEVRRCSILQKWKQHKARRLLDGQI